MLTTDGKLECAPFSLKNHFIVINYSKKKGLNQTITCDTRHKNRSMKPSQMNSGVVSTGIDTMGYVISTFNNSVFLIMKMNML